MTELLNTHQVAKELGVGLNAVYTYIKEGSLKAHKMGRFTNHKHWRIKREDLEIFINNGQQGEKDD